MKNIFKRILSSLLIVSIVLSSANGLSVKAEDTVDSVIVTVKHYLQSSSDVEEYSLFETVNYVKNANTTYPVMVFEKEYSTGDLDDSYDGYYTAYALFNGDIVDEVEITEQDVEVELYHNIGYRIHTELNGATLLSDMPTTYISGETIALPTATDLDFPGYIFDGWYTHALFYGSPITKIDGSFAEELYVYARWHSEDAIPVKVNHFTKDLGEATYSLEKSEIEYIEAELGDSLVLSSLKEEFLGFSYLNTKIEDTLTATTSLVEDLEVDIYYTRNTYDFNIAIDSKSTTYIQGVSGSGIYEYGANVTAEVSMKEGYLFSVWESNFKGFVPHSFDQTYTFQMPPVDITLTAHAIRSQSSILYELNGGVFTESTQNTYFHGDELVLPTSVEKYGYVFSGWYDNAEFKGNAITKIYATETTPKKYFAKWVPGEVTFKVKHWIRLYGTYSIYNEEQIKIMAEESVNNSSLQKNIPGYLYKYAKVDEVLSMDFTPNIAGTSIVNLYYDAYDETIAAATYANLEAIHVHSPVVSPVFITDADSFITERDASGEAKSWSGDKNKTGIQLVEGKINKNVDYQLMLDGTYHFKFDDALNSLITTHSLAEAIRYFNEQYHQSDYGLTELLKYIRENGWTGTYNPSDKYTNFKYVHFPFPVVLDGVYYEPTGGNGDTWIVLDDNYFETGEFYIPTWVDETEYCEIEFLVVSKSAWDSDKDINDPKAMNQVVMNFFRKNTEERNDIYNEENSKYYAYYKIPTQISGRIYDFRVTGLNDADTFLGVNSNWGSEDVSLISLEEEKAGKNNRVGEVDKRYVKSGRVTSDWLGADTLPIATGSSHVYPDMGILLKGTTLSYSFKTMGSMINYANDTVSIKPVYRYVTFDESGNEVVFEADEIGLYYKNDDSVYVSYDINKENLLNETTLNSERFKDAYKDFDLEKTRLDYNKEMGTSYTKAGFLERKVLSYNFSNISLDAKLRLFSGTVEDLKFNLDNDRNNLVPLFGTYIKSYTLANGNHTADVKAFSETIETDFHKSMQTWFGEYSIPDSLQVCIVSPDYIGTEFEENSLYHYYKPEFDKDNDGFLSLAEYSLQKNKVIEDKDPVWLKDGYLVLTFEITTFDEGEENLSYVAALTDQWVVEGMKTKALVDGKEISLRSGDICVINADRSLSEQYIPALNMN